MFWRVKKSDLSGRITVPPSKSHTIRAILIATLAEGESVIEGALIEGDGKSALEAAVALGAECQLNGDLLKIKGIGSDFSKGSDAIFMGNSGTGTRLFCGAAALGSKPRTFDGDESLRTRPMKPLLSALSKLGVEYTIHSKSGDIPFTVKGQITGGETTVSGVTSQFLSSLLLSTPLTPDDTVIHVQNLNEKPYIKITLWWLDKMGVRYDASNDFSRFKIYGNQKYTPFNGRIPGDFSSATFGAVAGTLTNGAITLDNIDFTDPQGDKEIFNVLEKMGANIKRNRNSATVSKSSKIYGIKIDLNAMPDALPALSVLGCIAEGKTEIVNVGQARIKETDRISIMTRELSKMGARIEEKDDGLVIYQSKLEGCKVSGYNDHRVVMALALAGIIAEHETIIDTAESALVTYPGFVDDFTKIGADIKIIE